MATKDKPDLPAREQDRLYQSLCDMAEILDDLNVNWFLGHGVALGAVRSGDLLPYDRDIDIIIPDVDTEKINAIMEAFEDSGKFHDIYSRADGHYRVILKKPAVESPELKNCVYFYRRYSEDFYAASVKPALSEDSRFYLPAFLFEKKTYVKIRDREFPTFTPVEKYLEWLYGVNWRTPDRRYGFRNFSTKHLRCKNEAQVAIGKMRINKGRTMVAGKRLQFQTLCDLDAVVVDNLHLIPRDIDAVVGIPRSGMLLANIICMYINRPLLTLGELLSGADPKTGRFRPPAETNYGRVLVVDDAIGKGLTFREIKGKLRRRKIEAIYLTGYASERTKDNADIVLKILPTPRAWQWNVFHHPHRRQMWDMDGVICEEPPKVDTHLAPEYKNHIENARLMISPSFPVDIVTGRREVFRRETEQWLEANQIKYNELIMRPPGLEGWQEIARYKAECYAGSDKELFVESSLRQAKRIAEISKKPVFCVKDRGLYK